MIELNTLGPVIKQAYEGENNTNAFTDAEKQKLAQLENAVPFSGSFDDLVDVPEILLKAQRAAANGVASLGPDGTVPMSQLNVAGLQFKGAWDASTNTPVIVDGTGTTGDFYKTGVAGTFNPGNATFNFLVGDWVVYAGGTWQRVGVHEAVASVNGKLGAVVLTAADVGALPNTYTPPGAEVLSVNGKKGAVVLSAADVGALPSTYTPPNQVKAWADITGKPDFATLYQKKQRGTIGPPIPAALIRKTTVQAAPTGTTITLAWNLVVYDQFDMLRNGNQLVVPSWAKYARLVGSVQWGGSSGSNTNPIRVTPQINGTTVPGMSPDIRFGNINVMTNEFTTAVFPVVSGDILSVAGYHSTSATRNIESAWVQVELYE